MATTDCTFGQCRCCLKNGRHRNIQESCDVHGNNKLYSDLFLDCFSLDMTRNKEITNLICESCICRLNDAFDFKIMVAESELHLLSQIEGHIKKESCVHNQPIQMTNKIEEVKCEHKLLQKICIKPNCERLQKQQTCCNKQNSTPEQQLPKIKNLQNVKSEEESLGIHKEISISKNVFINVVDLDTHSELDIKFEAEEIKEEFLDYVEYDDGTLSSDELQVTRQERRKVPSRGSSKRTSDLKSHIPDITKKYVSTSSSMKKSGSSEIYKNKFSDTHSANEYLCYPCNYTTNNLKLYKLHLRAHIPRFECDSCTYVATKRSNFVNHIKKHSFKTPYACKKCDMKFKHKYTLNRHVKSHIDNKPYVCEICGLKFVCSSYLNIHISKHKGEKPHACPMCEKKFYVISALEAHARVHTGEKPFACEKCGKKFARSSYLKDHTRIHTGEKPFACNICEAKFADRRNLKTHVRKHTGEKPICCNLCDEQFRHTAYLISHVKQMHKCEKPFACEICNETFSRRSDLHKHVVSKHPNKE